MLVRTFYLSENEDQIMEFDNAPIGKPNYGIYFSDILSPKPEKPKILDRNANSISESERSDESDNGSKKKKIKRRVSFDNDDAYHIDIDIREINDIGDYDNYDNKNDDNNNYDNNNNDDDNNNINNNDDDKIVLRENFEKDEIQNIKKKLKEIKKINKITEDAFAREEFKELASEILRNTFYNLLLESVHGEFSLMSESVKYLIKE